LQPHFCADPLERSGRQICGAHPGLECSEGREGRSGEVKEVDQSDT
jgi:hypothetical protein